ncbi:unnamed protein product [Owenia fusiformis]|uniref:Uncharacterized protein n=1 Tax=Owenia fusiformis TaxID=6347 RepID=A0A8J1UK52_OWEFU|nr:unnamed protein product [Owenia fusiformis]
MEYTLIIYTVLGLLITVNLGQGSTCDTDLKDVGSKAIFSQIVVESKILKKVLSDASEGSLAKYTAVVSLKKFYKGSIKNTKGKKPKSIKLNEFISKDSEDCLAEIDSTKTYILFLNSTDKQQHFITSSKPVTSDKKTLKLIRGILKKKPSPPKVTQLKPATFEAGKRLQLKCKIRGNPPPTVIWTKDGVTIKKKKGVSIKTNKKGSRLRIRKAKESDAGDYGCTATNVLGQFTQSAEIMVTPKPGTATKAPTKPWNSGKLTTAATVSPTTSSRHYEECEGEMRNYCLNNGTCGYLPKLKREFCMCPQEYTGKRCEYQDPFVYMQEVKRKEAAEKDRVITISAIIVGAVVIIGLCVLAYFLARRRKKQYYQRKQVEAATKKRENENNFTNASYRPIVPQVNDVIVRSQPKPVTLSIMTQTEPEMFGNHSNHLAESDSQFYQTPPPLGQQRRQFTPPGDVPKENERPRGAASVMKRPRLPAISSPTSNNNKYIVPVAVESDQEGSKRNSPSQLSRTESSQGDPHPHKVAPAPQSVNINIDDDEPVHSDYENNMPSDTDPEPELTRLESSNEEGIKKGGAESSTEDSSDTDSSDSETGVESQLLPHNHQGISLQNPHTEDPHSNPHSHATSNNLSWEHVPSSFFTDHEQYTANPYARETDIIDNRYTELPTQPNHRQTNNVRDYHY